MCIFSSLGRTRRFSEKFIQEERDKLKQYRESARKHYTELRTGAREELPRDFAQPLSVGNRVIAIHPKTREVRDGKILAVDHNKCNVLFDDLGVDSVMVKSQNVDASHFLWTLRWFNESFLYLFGRTLISCL